MFVHKHQLQYQLRPEHYYGAEQHRREVEELFLPAWHVVGTTAVLSRPGDYLTIEVLGRPLP